MAGGEAQHFVEGRDIPGDWWTLFHSKPLNDLIERALANSPDIKSAQAALTVARENVLAQEGVYWPEVNGTFSATRNKTSAQISPTPNSGDLYYNLFTPQISVSYVSDIFGLNRRAVETLRAQQEQSRFALAASHITLSANVASAAIQEASLRAQIQATRQIIASNTGILQILHKQFENGYASRLDVAAQESQVAQAEATLPPLLKRLAQQRDLLAALSGGFPDKDFAEKFELASLELPQELPVSLPSQLLEQRPDIRQAEENLHAASAQIGIARANRFPNLTLTADLGAMALTSRQIFSSDANFWALGADLAQPIFQGGALRHKERAAQAAYAQAVQQYRSTVITAFQNVADTLHALKHDADALKAAAAASDAATVTLELAKTQYEVGYANYVAVLSAEQTYQQAVIDLVQAQAARYTDTVALFQALGGGWWNRSDLPKG